MVVALLALLVAGIVYLHPTLSAPAGRTLPGSTRLQNAVPQFLDVSFGDANHGAVQLFTPGSNPLRAIYLTADGGRTWRPVARRAYPISAVTYVGQRQMLAEEAAGGTAALLISEDDGRTWQPLAADPRNLIAVGSWPVFLGSDGWWPELPPSGVQSAQTSQPVRIWHTSDGGRTWARLAASGIPQPGGIGQVRFVDPRHGAGIALTPDLRRLVLATSDGGDSSRTAATFDPPLASSRPWGLFLLQHGTRLVVWLAESGSVQFPPRAGELFNVSTFSSVSDDGGATWGPVRPGPVAIGSFGFTATIDDRDRLLYLDDHRLWISDDYGATWVARVALVPHGLIPQRMAAVVPGAMYAVAVRQSDVPTLLLNSLVALLRSSDGGIHWTEVQLPRLPT